MLTAANLPQVLVNCGNGFMVAECDLELRGAGEVLGKKQSGRGIKTTFKVSSVQACGAAYGACADADTQASY